MDVCESELAERRLERLSTTLWMRAPDGLMLVNGSEKILLANPRLEELFGYEEGELSGKCLDVLLPAPVRERHHQYVANYFRSPVTRPMGSGLELRGVRKSGEEFPVEVSLSPLFDPTDGLLVVSAVRDITEKKRAEAALKAKSLELERSNSELDQFARIASHDLQQPLRTIFTHLQKLGTRLGTGLDDEDRATLEYVLGEAKRMRELVRDLLAYSSLGGKPSNDEQVDCNDVVREVLERFGSLAPNLATHVKVGALPTVNGNRTELSLVFQNLLDNAFKYRGEGKPEIDVSCFQKHGKWVFCVQDNGIGIAPGDQTDIFLMFRRLHANAELPGNGVGLAICKKLVERRGESIWVESQPGLGSTFYFTWT